MRYFLMVLFCGALFWAPSVVAGPGHDHSHSHGPVSSEEASKKALKKLKQLVSAGKIDSSWGSVSPTSVEQKTYSKGPEWVVTFKNNQVSDASKQTLYLFYTLDGRYLAANYTGN